MPDDISPKLDFSSIPGHQVHETMEAPQGPSVGSVMDEAARIPTDPISVAGDVVSKITQPIENYTEEGRKEHPVLAKIGDLTKDVKELIGGGQAAGKPMGSSEGIANSPVTGLIAAPEASETGANIEEKVREYGPKVAEHLAETGRNFVSGLAEEGKSAMAAKAPATGEAGFVGDRAQVERGSDRRVGGNVPETERRAAQRRIEPPPTVKAANVQSVLRDKLADPSLSAKDRSVLESQLADSLKHPEDTDPGGDVGHVRAAQERSRTGEELTRIKAIAEGQKRQGFVPPAGYEDAAKRLASGESVESVAAGPKPAIKATAQVNPKTQSIVENAGGVYKGQNKDGLVEITLPKDLTDKIPGLDPRMKSAVSVTMPESHVTPNTVKSAIMRKFKEMGGSEKHKPVSPHGQGVLASIMGG